MKRFLTLLIISTFTTVFYAQSGFGIYPMLDNFRPKRYLGFDTTGFSQNIKPTEKYRKGFWLPRLRPTYFHTTKNGSKIHEFGITGSYINTDYLYKFRDSFYRNQETAACIALSANKNIRLLQSKNKKLSFWLGVNRSLVFDYSRFKYPIAFLGSTRNHNTLLVNFSVSPQLQYQYNDRLSFLFRWDNPSVVSIGISDDFRTFGNNSKKIHDITSESNLEVALYNSQWNKNFSIGARYALSLPSKVEEIPFKKPKKWKKSYWGIGVNLGIYAFRDGLREGYEREEESKSNSENYYTNVRPAFSVYHLYEDDKNYDEFYIAEPLLRRQYDQPQAEYYPLGKDDVQIKVGIVNERNTHFVLGFGHYKKAMRLSKNNFSFYTGTRYEFIHTKYKSTPSDNIAFAKSFQSNAIRLRFVAKGLWKINDLWRFEVNASPAMFLEGALHKATDDNPLNYNKLDGKNHFENRSEVQPLANILFGLNYNLKTIRVKN